MIMRRARCASGKIGSEDWIGRRTAKNAAKNDAKNAVDIFLAKGEKSGEERSEEFTGILTGKNLVEISTSNLHRHQGPPKYPIFIGTTAPHASDLCRHHTSNLHQRHGPPKFPILTSTMGLRII